MGVKYTCVPQETHRRHRERLQIAKHLHNNLEIYGTQHCSLTYSKSIYEVQGHNFTISMDRIQYLLVECSGMKQISCGWLNVVGLLLNLRYNSDILLDGQPLYQVQHVWHMLILKALFLWHWSTKAFLMTSVIRNSLKSQHVSPRIFNHL